MTDLGLAPPSSRGRRSANQTAVKKRDLTDSDINDLLALPEGALNSKASPLVKIRHTHHLLARLLAQGHKHVQIAAATGYSPVYISNIQNDPAFKNLIAFYQTEQDEIFTSVHERLAALGMVASEELLDRFAQEPDSFTNFEVMEALKLAADRSGAGPQSRNVNVNVNVGMGERLTAARARAFSVETEPPPPPLTLNGPESPGNPSPPILELRANQEDSL